MPIFDQGYQHWHGKLVGHIWRWWAITRQGIRTQLRNRRTKFFVLMSWTPAAALVFFLAVWGLFEQKSSFIKQFEFLFMILPEEIRNAPREFRPVIWTIAFHMFLWIEVGLSLLLVLMVGPDLISQDLRFNAFPLYLSRPLRRFDYFAGKLGVIVLFIASVTAIPALIAYVVGVAFSLDFAVVRDTWRVLLASVAYGLIVAVVCGLVILAFSSLSRNSRIVATMWVGLWLVTNMVAGALSETISRHDQEKPWQAVSFTRNLDRLREVMLDTESARDRIDDVLRKAMLAANTVERMVSGPGAGLAGRLAGRGRGLGRFAARPPREFDHDFDQDVGRNPFTEALVSPFPWTYSVGVLTGLCGISLCILSTRVKSLDRLR